MTSLRKLLSLGLLMGAWLALGGTSFAQYSCGTPSGGHCYGLNQWRDQPEYFGTSTDIKLGGIACAGCDGLLTNETWLVDEMSPGCSSQGACWVEAGYTVDLFDQTPYFFWDEVPPGGQYTQHNLGPADPVGSVDHFMIVKDGRVAPARFLVFVYNDSFSTLYGGVSNTFTGAAMKANRIDIGQELGGTHGIIAEPTDFRRNIWAVVPVGPEYVFWYAAQTAVGGVIQDRPPFAWWSIDPSRPGAPEGGIFTTAR